MRLTEPGTDRHVQRLQTDTGHGRHRHATFICGSADRRHTLQWQGAECGLVKMGIPTGSDASST